MKKTLAVLAVVIVVLGGLAWYLYQPPAEPVEAPPPVAQVAPEPEVQAEPEPPAAPPDAVMPETPEEIPQAPPEEEPLPPLEESDAYVSNTLDGLVGEAAMLRYFSTENIVPKAVATVDALSARQVPKPILPLNGPAGEYPAVPNPDPATVVRDEAGDPIPQFLSDPSGYTRYTPYVEMLEAVPPDEFVGLLRDNGPLFDEAFQQLGYADARFDDRLVDVIDELLATPEVDGPLRLMKPEAYYLYVDEDLEALSAGQKILLRMGAANAARVKSWLREVRAAL
ncbi:MAG: DUF3014 domain-containing protein [Xanthomonadales bacterium]